MYPHLAQLMHVRRASPQRLWPFPIDLQKVFAPQVTRLKLGALGASMYSLRHGGASDDLLAARRTLAEAQRRGCWKASSSLARYAKETRMLSELAKVPPAVLRHGALVESHAAAVLALRNASGRRSE